MAIWRKPHWSFLYSTACPCAELASTTKARRGPTTGKPRKHGRQQREPRVSTQACGNLHQAITDVSGRGRQAVVETSSVPMSLIKNCELSLAPSAHGFLTPDQKKPHMRVPFQVKNCADTSYHMPMRHNRVSQKLREIPTGGRTPGLRARSPKSGENKRPIGHHWH